MNFEQYRGKKVLLIGIGGGGDVVGTLPTYFHLERLGAYPVVGGLSWKRKRHDPEGRPRRIDEFRGIERYNQHIGIVNPDTELIDGSPRHIETHVAELLGKPVLTLDVSGMTRGTEISVKDYIQREQIDLLIGIDVGGDALCLGHEPTIRSPLADQIMLGTLSTTKSVLGIFGLGSDGELPIENFYKRFSDLRDSGGYGGALAHSDEDMQKVKPVFVYGKTECSAHAFRVAENMGEQERFELARQISADDSDVKSLAEPIEPVFARDGTRIAELNRLTPLTLFFDPSRVYFTNMFSKYMEDATSFADLIEKVRRRGVCTEFDDRY